MSASHTKATPAHDLRLLPGLGLVDFETAGLPASLADKVEGELEVFALHMRHGLLAAAMNVGLDVFKQLVEGEVTEVAGKKGKHNPDRRAVRHGTEPAKVPMGGRMVSVDKPRVRATDGTGEIALETWAALATRELLDRHTLVSMLAGVSTRSYAGVLEPAGPAIDDATTSIARSSVSRRFVAGTAAGLERFRSRPLGDQRWLVVYIDGFGLGEETLVGALGVDDKGNKVPLSVVHGTTENKAACKKLLDGIEDRGFDASGGVLFVIDGGKAIFHAITDKWGDTALIARCRVHKEKNILDLLPQSEHPWVKVQLHRAWKMDDATEAQRALEALADKIERTHPDAAASLREGLEHTLTVTRLGITGTLARTLVTTNPMESTIDIVKVHARNVKRWRAGDMRLRWAAAGMMAAESQYRRVKGYRQLDRLADAITAQIERRQLAAVA